MAASEAVLTHISNFQAFSHPILTNTLNFDRSGNISNAGYTNFLTIGLAAREVPALEAQGGGQVGGRYPKQDQVKQ